MTILTTVLSSLGGAAKMLAGSILPGAGNLGELVKAGKALTDAYATIKQTNGGTAPADAEAAHDALLKKVKAHADSTLGRLENG